MLSPAATLFMLLHVGLLLGGSGGCLMGPGGGCLPWDGLACFTVVLCSVLRLLLCACAPFNVPWVMGIKITGDLGFAFYSI